MRYRYSAAQALAEILREASLDNYSSDDEANLTVVIWTLILTKMLWRRLKNTDEFGVSGSGSG